MQIRIRAVESVESVDRAVYHENARSHPRVKIHPRLRHRIFTEFTEKLADATSLSKHATY